MTHITLIKVLRAEEDGTHQREKNDSLIRHSFFTRHCHETFSYVMFASCCCVYILYLLHSYLFFNHPPIFTIVALFIYPVSFFLESSFLPAMLLSSVSLSFMKFTLNIFDEQKKGRIQEEKKEEAQNHGYH